MNMVSIMPLSIQNNLTTITTNALFQQRLNDCFIQKWRADIESNQVLNTLYKHITTTFGIEFYLEHIISRKSRTMLTKLRVS